jgi:hypothetical protein
VDRLTSFVAGTTNLAYQYDADGNRTQFKNGTAISTYSYPTTSNKLTAITGSGGESYIYDASGSLTGIGANTLYLRCQRKTQDARFRHEQLELWREWPSLDFHAPRSRLTTAARGSSTSSPDSDSSSVDSR